MVIAVVIFHAFHSLCWALCTKKKGEVAVGVCEHKYSVQCFSGYTVQTTDTAAISGSSCLDRLIDEEQVKKLETRSPMRSWECNQQGKQRAVSDRGTTATVTEGSRLDSLLLRFVNSSALCFHIFSLVSAKSVS